MQSRKCWTKFRFINTLKVLSLSLVTITKIKKYTFESAETMYGNHLPEYNIFADFGQSLLPQRVYTVPPEPPFIPCTPLGPGGPCFPGAPEE